MPRVSTSIVTAFAWARREAVAYRICRACGRHRLAYRVIFR
jgi:hypothetical protein